MRIARRFLPLFGLVIFALALWALRKELEADSYAEILRALEGIGSLHLLGALGLTVVSFLILSCYDLLAVRWIGSDILYRRVAMASSLGYAFSQALGFPLLTGAPVRFRLYTSWGLSAPDITRVVGFYTFTFWLGLATVGGAVFLGEPGLAEHVLHGPVALVRTFGVLLLTPAVAYLAWAVVGRTPLRIRSFEFPGPGPRRAIAQLLIGMADWTVAGLVLYVLLPGGQALPPFVFIGAFLLAQTVGLVSTIPGGLGVFEATLISLLPEALPNPAILAALLAYRVVYYLMPLVLAVLSLGFYEALLKREKLARAGEAVREGLTSLVPTLLSASIFVAGASLLFTGAIPIPSDALAWFGSFLPLSVMEFSHFLGSIVGTVLLILAWGVQRRLDGAYHVTAGLLGLGALLAALRGAGALHAVSFLALLLVLWAAREGFQWLNLGMAPLSGLETGSLASIWNRIGTAIFLHGEHFYNFQGLRAYKEKFDPVWEPRYLASPGGLALPWVLLNLTSLISGGIVGTLKK
jgi:phosphatidylglycerol lysyltransferase